MRDENSKSVIWAAAITGALALCGTIFSATIGPAYLEESRARRTQTAAATMAENSQSTSQPVVSAQPSATPFLPPASDLNPTLPFFTQISPSVSSATETSVPVAETLIQESFDSNINDWSVGISDDPEYGFSRREIINGVYRFEVTSKKGDVTLHSIVPRSMNRDFILAFAANVKEIKSNSGYGYDEIPAIQVVFRMKDESQCEIYLSVHRYRIDLKENGISKIIIDWTESQAINLNKDIPNTFTISTKGSNTTLSANGQNIITFNNESPDNISPIKIGVTFPGADQSITVEFDNVVVTTNP